MIRKRRVGRLLGLAATLALAGCESIRLYAKDLLDPEASAAVTIPVKASILLFVLPPAIAWLPVSAIGLIAFHDETSVWFALAPGLLVGGPIVLLAGTPGYLLTNKPRPPVEDTAAVTSAG